MKRAFKYRFYPSETQAAELLRTFGCVRKVYNLALQARTEAWNQSRERVGYDTTSAMLTSWKRTEELAFLGEVSSVPLQQALRHLHTAFLRFVPLLCEDPSVVRMPAVDSAAGIDVGPDHLLVLSSGEKIANPRCTKAERHALGCGCGVTHDRDINAARNILAAGLAATVCGTGVRPQRSTPGGRSVMKQKDLRREL
ncbi:hypothetical protein BBK82_06315 [Lentzea guizhouensis]|uniref:Transposase putative helix-turn-helix domain-containing protein n=1 Tax=Lentzea guizhouensis TaxID=1586287 RepID=A0A1B2HDH6_9PSEU|nr:helix-turn-helix domain-containing protein [Lentzea guizhouensis]ANZ35752.1 hypothetical protein BBK82_06315 [Lentzea guizhouensis]